MKLDIIKKDIQKVADAISLVMNIDVTIVNDEMKRIAGTGIYKDKIGELIPFDSAFKKSQMDKKTLIIDNPKECVHCQSCFHQDSCKEEAEVCCPIVLDDYCYGVIGLIAFDKEQKRTVISRRTELVTFIEKMASLISGNLKAEIKSSAYNIERKRIAKVLDSMDRPVVSVDENGKIDSYNKSFLDVFGVSKEFLKEKYITEVVDFIDEEIMDKMKTTNKHSSTFFSEQINLKGIYNINKIYYKKDLKGFVIDFIDRRDTIRNYNKMNVDYRMSFDDIIGISKVIETVKETAKQASKSTSTILITGESGTGKELFARAIHFHSDRGNKPFVTINCAAIPEELLESELFGYEEGAFTGAKKGGKLGMFEIANKGTIFLDEIGDMSIHLQAKLLRVLQEKEIQKVGAKKSISVDVRIISATNKNLKELVERDMFREDLYYRLNVLPIKLPSLRDRKDDISLLIDHMISLYSDKLGKNITSMSFECKKILENYNWPGNIRELQNVIEYCVNMTNGEIIDDTEMIINRFSIKTTSSTVNYNMLNKLTNIGGSTNLNKNIYEIDYRLNVENINHIDSLKEEGIPTETEVQNKMYENISFRKIEDIEKEEIKRALEYYDKYKNTKELVSEALGISVPTLYRKIKKYNLG